MKSATIIIMSAAAVGNLFFSVAYASSFVKLPYAKGQSFIVVQGYNTLPTHIKKDSYAMDLTQNGCEAYGKAVVAASAGKAMLVEEQGYNGGYGTELIIADGNSLVSRYAHMIPGSITLALNEPVRQGETVGHIGDTGLVAGMACMGHPGTHLHFAMDIQHPDGSLTAYDPEPISGYYNVKAGNWYVSDNEEDGDGNGVVLDNVMGKSAAFVATSTAVVASKTASNAGPAITVPVAANIPKGGASVVPSSPSDDVLATPTVDATAGDTTTLATDTSSDDTTSTPTTIIVPVMPDVSSTPASASDDVLFEQPDESETSNNSWYGDNWYDLGNGFSGVLTTLTLRGKIDDQTFRTSHVALQEFKDPNYQLMVEQPFTSDMATATFSGLSIFLKPYFYYRLTTVQDYQNRSVILAGTSATGTAMWDDFVYGTGRVEYTKTFIPFISMEGVAATSTLAPPLLTAPTDLSGTFDDTRMELALSWSTSTDLDWPNNPLHYEINFSTSTSLDDGAWEGLSAIPVLFGNSYLIGVRAEDDFGDVSLIATATWNFPAGFSPYILSSGMRSGSQSFVLPFTTTLHSIEIFTADFMSTARDPSGSGCSLSLSYIDANSSYVTIPADNGYTGYSCAGDITFSFASSSPILYVGQQYEWVFQTQTGNPSTEADVQFFGKQAAVEGEMFSDPSLGSARFVLNGGKGVLLSN
jgi:hypothetical protein